MLTASLQSRFILSRFDSAVKLSFGMILFNYRFSRFRTYFARPEVILLTFCASVAFPEPPWFPV
jgi:hypothetical protein